MLMGIKLRGGYLLCVDGNKTERWISTVCVEGSLN